MKAQRFRFERFTVNSSSKIQRTGLSRKQKFVRLAALLIIASVLRPPIAGVGPHIPVIEDDLNLSGVATALLGSLPVLCFGVGAFFTPFISRKLGLNGALTLIAVGVLAGLAVRITGGSLPLFIGTAIVGLAISWGNTILPTVIKTDFPKHIGVLTGMYTTVMSGLASFAALIAVPLAGDDGTDWKRSLGFWGIIAVIALVMWLPQMRHQEPRGSEIAVTSLSLWRHPVAWSVSIFMGLQSVGFYAILAWLPSLLQDSGHTPTEAGILLGICTSVGIPMGLILPPFIKHTTALHIPIALFTGVALAGILGLMFAPSTLTLLWLVMIGVGQGATFPLALNLITIRGATPAITTALSAMAQGVGYLIAAAGTYLIGAIHTATSSWTTAIAALAILTAMQIASGWHAGREHVIGEVE
jgi:CP family cyanate transporter-like MFS transporter